jgi:site-specific DNA-methyltransferase (adenine-specific)
LRCGASRRRLRVGYEILRGDCIEVLRAFPDNSFDAVVTDPPYGLEFMGKDWDAPWKTVGFTTDDPASRGGFQDGTGGNAFSRSRVSYGREKGFQEWCELWASECYRILKPGGHILAFGGSRMYHRLACAIEDCGFEIRDSIHWVYGSGFPKSHDVSHAIDKLSGAERTDRASSGPGGNKVFSPTVTVFDKGTPVTEGAKKWSGWGTALKPAHEPIVVGRKPLETTVARNVLEHGVGAINVDGCRVPHNDNLFETLEIKDPTAKGVARVMGGTSEGWDAPWKHDPDKVAARVERANASLRKTQDLGRWPPNVLLTHSADCTQESCVAGCPVVEMNEQSGFSKSPPPRVRTSTDERKSHIPGHTAGEIAIGHDDSGGAARFFPAFRYQPKPSVGEKDKGLAGPGNFDPEKCGVGALGDNGRGKVARNTHPTVKPVELMRWLVRLVTPKGGRVIDPFLGSGTTGVAAVAEMVEFVGIEREEEYANIASARIADAFMQASNGTDQLELFDA